MSKKELVFKIDMETAEVQMEAVGFQGQGCRDATRPYEDALGVVISRDMKGCAWASSQEERRIDLSGSNQ